MLEILRLLVGILLFVFSTGLLVKTIFIRTSWEIKAFLTILAAVGLVLIILHFT